MTAGPRAAALLAALVGLLLAAALSADVRATQQALQRQLQVRNHDAAAVLAAVLSQSGSDTAAWRAVAVAQFEVGNTRHLRLLASGRGEPVVELQRPAPVAAVPDWFRRALPLRAAPGAAVLGTGGSTAGTLELEVDPTWAQDALWDSFLRTGVAASLLALLSLLLAARALLARRGAASVGSAGSAGPAAPGAATLPAHAPVTPIARPIAPAADDAAGLDVAAAARWREAFAAQAEQVAQLQRAAQLDPVTGLPLRSHFLGLLQQRLDEPGGPGLALLIVRVLDLDATNLRLGHEATDRLLGAVADVLLTYVDRVPATLAGRLNGTDFALCLPVAGLAAETAASLRTALAATPALRSGHTEVAVAGVDGLRDATAGAALAAADAALARAEADGDPAAASVVLQASAQGEVLGAGAWRERIRTALIEGRTRLAAVPVFDARGHGLHLECALHVQLRHGGAFESAERWRAAARRSRLLPQVDLAAVERALEDLARDGRARAVQISRSSLTAPAFTTDVAAALLAAPAAARRLALELVDDVRAGAPVAPVAAALSVWARLGVRVGVSFNAGAAPALPELKAAGVHYVKLDAGQVRGLAADDAVRGYARSVVALVHGLDLTLVVTGVRDAADVAVLWALGVDAASGPALAESHAAGQGV